MSEQDLILRALKRFEQLMRARKYGGSLEDWKLAKAALEEYVSRVQV